VKVWENRRSTSVEIKQPIFEKNLGGAREKTATLKKKRYHRRCDERIHTGEESFVTKSQGGGDNEPADDAILWTSFWVW